MDFDRIIEKLIRDAQAEGKFDNLQGQGKPLKLDEAAEGAETWAADHLLKNSGHRPAWLEEDAALQAELEQARAALRRSWAWRQAELTALGGPPDPEAQRRREWVEAEWTLAQARFRERVAELNQQRRLLNLKVPLERFQRRLVDVEAEIHKATSA